MTAEGTSVTAKKKTRLAEELRANLARRKAQTRARRAGEADLRDEGIEASESSPADHKNPDEAE